MMIQRTHPLFGFPLAKPRTFGFLAGLGATATFSSAVEAWRARLAAAAPDLPTDFLLAWINKESAGNICSYTSYAESGIFQLMPPDNTRDGGTTEAALRSACVAGTQKLAHTPTEDEINEQVRSGVQYVRHVRDVARARLDSIGADWPDDSADFWSMVKLVHTLPSLMNGLEIATGVLGRPPASWSEFVAYGANGLNGASKWLPFAAGIGAYGAGWISPLPASTGALTWTLLGGLLLGALAFSHGWIRRGAAQRVG